MLISEIGDGEGRILGLNEVFVEQEERVGIRSGAVSSDQSVNVQTFTAVDQQHLEPGWKDEHDLQENKGPF